MLQLDLPALPGVPSRAILLWPLAFDQALYPQLTGYVLCNGLNGTPDIRDRTPRGTPIAGVVLAVGGAATHDHGAGTYASAAHAHVVQGHQHTVPDHYHTVPAHCHTTDSHEHTISQSFVDVCPVDPTQQVVEYVTTPTGSCTVIVNARASMCTDTISGINTGSSAPNTDPTGPNAVAGTSAAGSSMQPWMNMNFIMRL